VAESARVKVHNFRAFSMAVSIVAPMMVMMIFLRLAQTFGDEPDTLLSRLTTASVFSLAMLALLFWVARARLLAIAKAATSPIPPPTHPPGEGPA
jgi:Na+/melibiose symporter-like transporter